MRRSYIFSILIFEYHHQVVEGRVRQKFDIPEHHHLRLYTQLEIFGTEKMEIHSDAWPLIVEQVQSLWAVSDTLLQIVRIQYMNRWIATSWNRDFEVSVSCNVFS